MKEKETKVKERGGGQNMGMLWNKEKMHVRKKSGISKKFIKVKK